MSVQQVIDNLQKQGFTLYLGGSRRMAELHPEDVVVKTGTDYDYYATYSENLEKVLAADPMFRVFDDMFVEYEYDDETVKIATHLEYGLQIVLRKDAEFYRSVFESIDPEFYTHFLWKSSTYRPNRTNITPFFNALFAAARSMLTSPHQTCNTVHNSPPDPLKAYEYAMKGIR